MDLSRSWFPSPCLGEVREGSQEPMRLTSEVGEGWEGKTELLRPGLRTPHWLLLPHCTGWGEWPPSPEGGVGLPDVESILSWGLGPAWSPGLLHHHWPCCPLLSARGRQPAAGLACQRCTRHDAYCPVPPTFPPSAPASQQVSGRRGCLEESRCCIALECGC